MVQHVGGGCTQTWVADRLGNEEIWTMHRWGFADRKGITWAMQEIVDVCRGLHLRGMYERERGNML